MFNTSDIKYKVLENLRRAPPLKDTDFLWKINLFLRKKSVKKTEVVKLVKDCLIYMITIEGLSE